jgi:plastocyanin
MRPAAAVLLVAFAVVTPVEARAGTITGVVGFTGTAPVRTKLRRDSDPFCDKTAALAEDVIVTDGKLRDVVVRIKNGTAGVHAVPEAPVVLTQRACTYAPHVITAIAGQKLAVKNADRTYHNVHAWLGRKTLWNDSHPADGPDIIKDSVGAAGDVLELKCDVHPWMHAYVVVSDHPFVAVTGDDGTFTITGIPAGKYTVEAWHPTLGVKSTKVTVAKKGKKATARAAFSFAPVAPAED